jgi:hypothetical protein
MRVIEHKVNEKDWTAVIDCSECGAKLAINVDDLDALRHVDFSVLRRLGTQQWFALSARRRFPLTYRDEF